MKALFLCMDMHNGLHGSLLHILEYGEYFLEQGYEVNIGSMAISAANRKLAEEAGFAVHDWGEIPLDADWDIVYALHAALFPALLARGLKYSRAITSTLSAFTGIEVLPPGAIWPYFDLITAVSEEAAYAHSKRYGLKNLFEIIPNHIPLSFMKRAPRSAWNREIRRAAFISNHPLPQIDEIKRRAPFQLDLIGGHYGNIQRVTPDFLLQYDAVISIGKTVQYCMGLGIPIFEYGHFGGCGYMEPENMAEEEKTNFSGRGTKRRLNPAEFIESLSVNYAGACAKMPLLCELARSRYDIAALIERQLNLIKSKPALRPPLKREALLYADGANALLSFFANLRKEREDMA